MRVQTIELEQGSAAGLVPDKPQSDQWKATLPPLWVWRIGNVVFLVVGMVVGAADQDQRLDMDTSLAAINFLSPSGYAFIIWAVIFLLEFVFLGWQLCAQIHTWGPERIATFRNVSAAFCMAHTFQALWALTFRYSFKSAELLWISAVLLGGIAASLSFAHKAVSASAGGGELWFMYPGITIHFGWVTCATLVNWNAWTALVTQSPEAKLAVVVLSLIVAVAMGLAVGIRRGSVLYAGTICWASTAVGVRTVQQPAEMVAGLGEVIPIALGIAEIVVGAGVLAASLGFKARQRKRSRRNRSRIGLRLRLLSLASGLTLIP